MDKKILDSSAEAFRAWLKANPRRRFQLTSAGCPRARYFQACGFPLARSFRPYTLLDPNLPLLKHRPWEALFIVFVDTTVEPLSGRRALEILDAVINKANKF